MTWIRVDADMPWNDKIVELPTDTARFAYVKVLCAAKIRGRSDFSKASLRESLGSHARAIADLVRAGLVEESDDGTRYSVRDFDEYQRRAGHAEVMQRSRARHNEVTETSPTRQNIRDVRDVTSPPTPSRGKSHDQSTGTFMGFRPRSMSTHDGRHGPDCIVCNPASV